MAAWLTPDDLRGFVKNLNQNDEEWLQLAVDAGMDEVEDTCGPVLVETITDEYVPATTKSKALLSCRVRSLTSVTDAATGDDLTAQFIAIRQTLRRVAGGAVAGPLLVTFTSGVAESVADVPSWARAAGLLVAQQSLRTQRRFGQNATDGPAGFLVPKAAEDHMSGYELIKGLGL